MLHLGHFLATLPGYTPTGAEPIVSAVVTDSREVEPGDLFVALPGERVDGHDFVAAAFQRGAVAALVARPVDGALTTIDTRDGVPAVTDWSTPVALVVTDPLATVQAAATRWRESLDKLRVVGVTGSVGKTTTKEMIHAVLATRYTTFKSPGNRNSVIGLPPALFSLRSRHECAVLEMGMYLPGEIRRLCEIAQPQVGVVTLIDAVHMSRVGSLEGIIRAKRELVEALPADGVAILNDDDDNVRGMAPHTAAQVFTYGLTPRATLWAGNIESLGLRGIQFTLHYGRETLHVQTPLLGQHSVQTALRAAAVGLVEGMAWEDIVRGLQGHRDELRLMTTPGPSGSLFIDDTYNASPASTLAALNLLEELNGGRKIAVLGAMLELGAVEHESHVTVGRRAAEVADVIVAVGPLGHVIGDAAAAVDHGARHVIFVADPPEAVEQLARMLKANDVVLVKGSRGANLDYIIKEMSAG